MWWRWNRSSCLHCSLNLHLKLRKASGSSVTLWHRRSLTHIESNRTQQFSYLWADQAREIWHTVIKFPCDTSRSSRDTLILLLPGLPTIAARPEQCCVKFSPQFCVGPPDDVSQLNCQSSLARAMSSVGTFKCDWTDLRWLSDSSISDRPISECLAVPAVALHYKRSSAPRIRTTMKIATKILACSNRPLWNVNNQCSRKLYRLCEYSRKCWTWHRCNLLT